MKTVVYKHPSKYVGVYDETFQPGDLITAYQKGIHEFVAYEERKGAVPLVHYKRIFDSNGKPAKGKVVMCDAAYCRRARPFLVGEIEKRESELANLRTLLNSLPD